MRDKTVFTLALILIAAKIYAQKTFFKPKIYSIKDDSLKNETFFYPLVAWNRNNMFMPGIYITNQIRNKKIFRYQLLPMYSTEAKNIVGLGKISYNRYFKNKQISQLSAFVSGKRFNLNDYNIDSFNSFDFVPNTTSKTNFQFAYYQYEVGLSATFENLSDSSLYKHIIELKYHKNETELLNWSSNFMLRPTFSTKSVQLNAMRAKWTFLGFDRMHPQETSLEIDAWSDFARTKFKYEQDFRIASNVWITIKGISYIFLFIKPDFAIKHDGRTGTNVMTWNRDVFYDSFFLGRGIYKNEYFIEGMAGSGALYSNLYGTLNWDWNTSSSISISLPQNIPIRLYAAGGIAPDILRRGQKILVFEAGILIMPPQKFFEIAIPLFFDNGSKNFHKYYYRKHWTDRFRIIINFDRINPHKWIDNKQLWKAYR